MFKKNFIINLFLIFFFQINVILADAFDSKIDEIRAEINRNDLKSAINLLKKIKVGNDTCLLYTSPSPRDRTRSRMPSSA